MIQWDALIARVRRERKTMGKVAKVYIDAPGAQALVFQSATFNERLRMYYRTQPPTRAIVRVDCGDIETVTGCVVDASIGWDAGTPGFVLPGFEGLRHTKITIRRVLPPSTAYDHWLSGILQDAPRGV